MSTAKHTLAPWRCQTGIKEPTGVIWGGDYGVATHVATCTGPEDDELWGAVLTPTNDEQQANMRLIAAAPELQASLLAMLEITCGKCGGGDPRCVTPDGRDACGVAQRAKVALKKAEGEE